MHKELYITLLLLTINIVFVKAICADSHQLQNHVRSSHIQSYSDFKNLPSKVMKKAMRDSLNQCKPGSLLYNMTKTGLNAMFQVKKIAETYFQHPEKRIKLCDAQIKHHLPDEAYQIIHTFNLGAVAKGLSLKSKEKSTKKSGFLKWMREGPYRGCFVIKPENTDKVTDYKQCNIIFKSSESGWEIVTFEINNDFDGRWYWAEQKHEEISSFIKKNLVGPRKKILDALPPGKYPELNADQYVYYYTKYPRDDKMTPVPGKSIHVNAYLYWVTEDGFRMPVKLKLVVGPQNEKWLIKKAAIDSGYCSKVAQQLRAARFINKYVAMKDTNREKYTCSWSKSFVTIPSEATIIPSDRERMVMSLDEGLGRELENSVKAKKRWDVKFRAYGVDEENVKQYNACIFLTNANNYLVYCMYSR